MATTEGIKQVDLVKIDVSAFKQQNTGCIVLTHDRRILLQHRPDNWRTFPGMIATFGGHIEAYETPSNAIVRELHKELSHVSQIFHRSDHSKTSLMHQHLILKYMRTRCLGKSAYTSIIH